MLASAIPAKFDIPFAQSAGDGFVDTVPLTTSTPGRASLTLGFPPLNFQPLGSGGIPPFGEDMNGILNQISAWSQWVNAGAPVIYDAAFSTAIGGYPNGAYIYSVSGGAWWLSTVDNNSSDPETGGANWQKIAYGQTYAGNPNGAVAGNSGTSIAITQSMLWDTTNSILWLCTSSGPASGIGQAVWTQIASTSAGVFWCNTSTGTASAQIVAPPTALQTMQPGIEISWKVGTSLSNTGAATLTIGSLGTFAILRDSPSGPIALTGGEMVAANAPSARFDGSVLHLIAGAQGTAAKANASSNTGVLAAVTGTTTVNNLPAFNDTSGTLKNGPVQSSITGTISAVGDAGSITVGHIAVFSDISGTIIDGGPAGSAAAPTYINYSNNNQVLGPGVYNADTSTGEGGAFTILLPAIPTLGMSLTFNDISGTFSPNNLTISRNGNTIKGITENVICNTIGLSIMILYNGTTWEFF